MTAVKGDTAPVTPLALPRPVGFVLGGGAINGALLAEDPRGAANRLSHLWLQASPEIVFPGNALEGLGGFVNGAPALVTPALVMVAAIAPLALIAGGICCCSAGGVGCRSSARRSGFCCCWAA